MDINVNYMFKKEKNEKNIFNTHHDNVLPLPHDSTKHIQ